jgi:hypothetical protein
MMANKDTFTYSHAVERDLRLDLFRGIGLWMIFLDHIPDDFVSWLTLRNYGFSDAAEFFVFISGYLAGYIYGPIIRAGNFLAALKRLWTRVWQMYVAHIMLFLLFTAQIARTVRKFDNPMYEDEFNVHNFLQHPDVLIGQALTLRYKPVDLDVLPLYITLIAASPLILWCLLRRPNWTLLGSVLLYIGARIFDWNFASYPPGTHWYFNPFAWQLMFVFAAWCGVGGIAQLQGIIRSRVALIGAVAWMAFALLIVMTWHSAFLESLIPKWMIKAIYPISICCVSRTSWLWRWWSPDIFRANRRYSTPNGCVRWCCAVSIRCRFFVSAYSCPLERIGSWFSTPRTARARSGCNCSSASAAS